MRGVVKSLRTLVFGRVRDEDLRSRLTHTGWHIYTPPPQRPHVNSCISHNSGTLSCRGHCISVVATSIICILNFWVKNIFFLFNTNVYYIFVMLGNIWVHFKSIFFRFTAEVRLSSWILVQPKDLICFQWYENFQRCRNIIMLGLCPYKSGQPVFFQLCRLEYHFQKKLKRLLSFYNGSIHHRCHEGAHGLIISPPS